VRAGAGFTPKRAPFRVRQAPRGTREFRAKRGAPGTFRTHPAPVLLAPSTVTSTASTPGHVARSAATCAPSAAARDRFCFAPSTVMGSVSTTACFFSIPAWLSLLGFFTEAERPRHVNPVRRSARSESHRTAPVLTGVPISGQYAESGAGLCGASGESHGRIRAYRSGRASCERPCPADNLTLASWPSPNMSSLS
jgi:hypothetical protein